MTHRAYCLCQRRLIRRLALKKGIRENDAAALWATTGMAKAFATHFRPCL